MLTLHDVDSKRASEAGGVLIVEVFYKSTQGIVAVTYDPRRLKPGDLLVAIEAAAKDIGHYYGAELIGQQPTLQAIHLQ